MSSYLPLLIFILITTFYYLVLKVPLNVNILNDESGDEFKIYTKTNYIRLFIYFMLIVLTQFGINASVMVNKCGGNISQNIGGAALMTFIPWIFIFGMVIAVLIIFPGFKSAFSNVIGYFAVAGSANRILANLLVNQDIEDAIRKDPNMSESKKRGLHEAADAIIKLCGNMSVMINQITPTNFLEYWALLTPLMKDEYQKTGAPELKSKLLQVVVNRDNIGESMWYIYTAILLTSIIQYKMTTTKCATNVASMQSSYNDYLTQQAATDAATQKAGSTVYTITN